MLTAVAGLVTLFSQNPAKTPSSAGSRAVLTADWTRMTAKWRRTKSALSTKLASRTAKSGLWDFPWTNRKRSWLWAIRWGRPMSGIWTWRSQVWSATLFSPIPSVPQQSAKPRSPKMEIFWFVFVMTGQFGGGTELLKNERQHNSTISYRVTEGVNVNLPQYQKYLRHCLSFFWISRYSKLKICK